MNFNQVPKKTQLISLDSKQKTTGTNNSCVFDLRSNDSQIFLENLTDVIGVRLIDYHVATIRSNVYSGPYVIDIQIDEIPTRGQILDQEFGTVFARIPIDRTDSVSSPSTLTHAQSVDPSHNKTSSRYFNPISLPKLSVRLTQLSGVARERTPLQSDCGWYMLLEITTLDHDVPKLDRLESAIEDLSRHIREMPPPQIVQPVTEQSKKIPIWKLLVPLVLFLSGVFWFTRSSPGGGGVAPDPIF
tara:strand:- start:176 stop:907 length:732 start_codon:yes stop_codon:yes gene_type:complete